MALLSLDSERLGFEVEDDRFVTDPDITCFKVCEAAPVLVGGHWTILEEARAALSKLGYESNPASVPCSSSDTTKRSALRTVCEES
jgi:hypothetical protein